MRDFRRVKNLILVKARMKIQLKKVNVSLKIIPL